MNTKIDTRINQFYSLTEPISRSIVFVKPIQHKIKSDNGVYVEMIEYNNLEGFIPCTEINRWKVNLDTFFKYDKIYPCLVLRKDGNNFDLSFIKVRKSDINILEDAYTYMSRIVNIIEKLARDLNLTQEQINVLCENTIYKILYPQLYDKVMAEQKNIIKDKFEQILLNPKLLFNNNENKNENIDIDIDIDIDKYVNSIKKRVIIKPLIMSKEFTLTIIDDNSLEKLKEIFKQIIKNTSIYNNCMIECKSSPKYYIKLEGDNEQSVIENIDSIVNIINSIIKSYTVISDFSSEPSIIKNIEIQYN